MSLITPSELKDHIETSLSTTALQLLIDDAEADIIVRFGEHTTATEDVDGSGSLLFLRRRAQSITSMTELTPTQTPLDTNDYALRDNGMIIERVGSGTVTFGAGNYTMWAGRGVRVTYVPFSDIARRKRVLIDLCRLSLQHSGLASVRTGDFSETSVDNYNAERDKILDALTAGTRGIA